jgi:hypothetical protein
MDIPYDEAVGQYNSLQSDHFLNTVFLESRVHAQNNQLEARARFPLLLQWFLLHI